MEGLPILQNMATNNGESAQTLPRSTFERIFKSVWMASGHFESATVHAMRRSLGKKVNGM